ncbi:carboxypeptidase-like regulatory domain-containing protein [Hymenobacter latericus]|uniref:carboxypeptidase-like regulatory domain-containing protein n=1 Tax=Hymenobacter sp. YIM 151858-1 TaxID=2987688 RepID=UPI00222730D7|nr:carboxypeptidase-like regulatory domain-containing protein [Hymenobacter sp. YIM 151858-1]UYZ58306.1 carboxypeptidase-like regulatory domain-containing protein [Hymenobacter sp. YIM 151858-1]
MPRAAIQVEVPRPCAEAWEAMTPTAHGRHCAACQHTVTDFTHKTDAEVLALLRQAAGRRVCGRFRADQLQRPLQVPRAAARWHTWLLAAGALLGLRALGAPAAQAQTAPAQHPRPSQLPAPVPVPQVIALGMVSPSAVGSTPVTGQVLDAATREPIPGATVLVKGTLVGVSTDAEGRFRLNVPTGAQVLQISSVGYVRREVTATDALGAAPIELEMSTKTLGELVYVRQPWYAPRTWWHVLRSVPRRVANVWR